ncbi:hypothetical protein [Acidiphilium acidophilum]|uniref:hypothetical protein n=1 Tax=Acidiphilium acidophilum TaxID=76588 RepID=UPI002E8E613D|nr:hypothetical protein [Acidiphilium acidophilum]
MTNQTSLAIQELMTGSAVKNRMTEITDRAAEIKGESQWRSELSDLVRLQAEELDRLNCALEDAASVPPRRPLLATVSSTTLSNGLARDTVLTIDDRGDLWLITNPTQAQSHWARLPRLPEPIEISKSQMIAEAAAAKAAETEANRERLKKKMAEMGNGR